MDPWRRQVDCLFGLSVSGRPLLGDGTFNAASYDSTYVCPRSMQQRVDRIPFEAIVGWDTTGNGNLAQMLQEPTLMGAYEGAGITVLGQVADGYGVADLRVGAEVELVVEPLDEQLLVWRWKPVTELGEEADQ